MVEQLFRKEAMDSHSDRLCGDVLLLPRISYKLILTILLVWVVATLYWLFTSTFTKRAVVEGWLEPDVGIARVFSPAGGLIKKIMVSNGELVEKGQSLVTISNDRSMADGKLLGYRLIEEYEVQEKLLKNQIKLAGHLYEKKLEELTGRIDIAVEGLEQIDQQIETSDKRLDLATRQFARHDQLSDSGHVSLMIKDSSAEQLLKLKGERQALVSNRGYQLDRVRQLQRERDILPDQHRKDLNQLHASLSDITQKILQAKGQDTHVIRASRKGIVDNLQVREGQYVRGNFPLLNLIPNDVRLVARVLVPVEAAGFVSTGQAINIRYTAFPYQKFGAYRGVIEDISNSVLLPSELLSAPISSTSSVYSLSVVLDAQIIHAYGKDILLKSGMTFSADINLDQRTLMEWLLEPIYNLKGRVF